MPLLALLMHFFQDAAKTAAPNGAAGGGAAAPPGGGLGSLIVPLLGFFVIFWLFMWRPQAKERKARQAMLDAVKKGDRILLACGLVGEVAALTEQDVLVRFDDKDPRRMRFRRFAIQSVLTEETPAAEPAEAETK
jgi:preprotein translocase subunit YajC